MSAQSRRPLGFPGQHGFPLVTFPPLPSPELSSPLPCWWCGFLLAPAASRLFLSLMPLDWFCCCFLSHRDICTFQAVSTQLCFLALCSGRVSGTPLPSSCPSPGLVASSAAGLLLQTVLLLVWTAPAPGSLLLTWLSSLGPEGLPWSWAWGWTLISTCSPEVRPCCGHRERPHTDTGVSGGQEAHCWPGGLAFASAPHIPVVASQVAVCIVVSCLNQRPG